MLAGLQHALRWRLLCWQGLCLMAGLITGLALECTYDVSLLAHIPDSHQVNKRPWLRCMSNAE